MYKRGKAVRGPMISLRYCPNEKRITYRLAVVVSRKVSKSAVVRNRIRRRLYECVRILSSSFTDAYDLALLVYDEKVAELPPEKLAAEVVSLLKKAGVTPKTPKTHGIVETKE